MGGLPVIISIGIVVRNDKAELWEKWESDSNHNRENKEVHGEQRISFASQKGAKFDLAMHTGCLWI